VVDDNAIVKLIAYPWYKVEAQRNCLRETATHKIFSLLYVKRKRKLFDRYLNDFEILQNESNFTEIL